MICACPRSLADAAERRETHELARYCHEVASLFSQFYRDCRVLSDDERLTRRGWRWSTPRARCSPTRSA